MVRSGFTLIELLVVITIIVVLLALLAPALDKAIYQAELAVCATQTRNIAQGAIGYAMDAKRQYPRRGGVMTPPPLPLGSQPVDIAFSIGATTYFDDRPKLEGYIALGRSGHLLCPLTGRIDIGGSDSDTWIMSTYALYFGWSFMNPDSSESQLSGMQRIGSRMIWNSQISAPDRYRFSVLAADDDLITSGQDTGYSTHPDDDGLWSNLVNQDTGIPGYKVTFSRWQGSPFTRGTMDLNFALDDGSVMRIEKVGYRHFSQDTPAENKVVPVPYITRTADDSNFYRHLPAQY